MPSPATLPASAWQEDPQLATQRRQRQQLAADNWLRNRQQGLN